MLADEDNYPEAERILGEHRHHSFRSFIAVEWDVGAMLRFSLLNWGIARWAGSYKKGVEPIH
jgi:hypothetical protein